jgi:hypothetical protein
MVGICPVRLHGSHDDLLCPNLSEALQSLSESPANDSKGDSLQYKIHEGDDKD